MSHLLVITTFISEVTTFSSEKASGLPVSGYGILLVTLSHFRGNMPLKTTLRVVSILPQSSLIYTGNIAIITISTVLPWLPSFQSCCATWYGCNESAILWWCNNHTRWCNTYVYCCTNHVTSCAVCELCHPNFDPTWTHVTLWCLIGPSVDQ